MNTIRYAFDLGYADRRIGCLRPKALYPRQSIPRRAYMAGWGLADAARKLGRI